MTDLGKQNVPGLCAGVSSELHPAMLTKAACTTPSLEQTWISMEHRYHSINRYKSSLNWPWLERTACLKRQEVSSILFTHWNAASSALLVLALNSNYLDNWLNANNRIAF